MKLPEPLEPKELYRATDLAALGFETTADLEKLDVFMEIADG